MRGNSDEPVFVRTGGQWHYNARNRVGRVLIAVTAPVVAGLLYVYADSTRWSDAELRAAVHEAAAAVESRQRPAYALRGGYAGLLRDEVHAAGEGPPHGARVDPVTGSGAADRFEVTTPDTGTAYCFSVTPPERELPRDAHGWHSSEPVGLTVDVAEGPC
ncbi:hypothetical protein [Streptomyces sp. enrichment culture]|uniref:hypothetical protein n=1 Tax=Streptomyces sp. enrichment culture TaxID=1795815 RepID=UPI003F5779A1